MDILSESAEAARNSDFPGSYDALSADSAILANNVHYLPTVLTKLQEDMCEAVVQICSPLLQKEIVTRTQRASINSLLDADEPVFNGQSAPELAAGEVGTLLFDQLKRISRHPSLVVDHFIPKKLLLLEPKSRLLPMSGKLIFFNKLVDLISEKYESGDENADLADYNLLAVAESVKELEWMEGLIIGKKLHYLHLSARKLYEEEDKQARFVKEESVDEEVQSHEFKKRRRHYLARISKRKRPAPLFTVHLITSRQLYLGYSSNTPIDLIVSFDSEIDVSSGSIELLRSNNKVSNRSLNEISVKTPVIVPVSLFSIEHIMSLLPRPALEFGHELSVTEKLWKLLVASAFIVNRFQIFKQDSKNFYLNAYGQDFSLLLSWLFNWDKQTLSPEVKTLLKYTLDVSLNYSDVKLESRLKENYLKSLGKLFADTANGWDNSSQAIFNDLAQLTYEICKKRLAEFLNGRIEQTRTLIHEGTASILPKFRECEAERQEEIDKDEDLVGIEYRKLRKLNEDANIVDRKFNRSENEHARVQAQETETREMLVHLEDYMENKTDEELQTLIDEQTKLLDQLIEEKSKLDEDYEKIVAETESLRTEYQTKSADAVQATNKLSSAKALQTLLESKLSRPGMSTLPTLARQDEYQTYETKLKRLLQENAFIKLLFLQKLDQLVKERSAIVDSTSSGSTSRPSNRISRASTPFT